MAEAVDAPAQFDEPPERLDGLLQGVSVGFFAGSGEGESAETRVRIGLERATGFEPATLGLGIRSALFLHVSPDVEGCRPVRVLAAILVASVSPNSL